MGLNEEPPQTEPARFQRILPTNPRQTRRTEPCEPQTLHIREGLGRNRTFSPARGRPRADKDVVGTGRAPSTAAPGLAAHPSTRIRQTLHPSNMKTVYGLGGPVGAGVTVRVFARRFARSSRRFATSCDDSRVGARTVAFMANRRRHLTNRHRDTRTVRPPASVACSPSGAGRGRGPDWALPARQTPPQTPEYDRAHRASIHRTRSIGIGRWRYDSSGRRPPARPHHSATARRTHAYRV
ncbi:hypothetical protein SAMN05216355_1241 [Actinomyces ruminicola]|uniref:Uncharacterized protein n=1 Tax=Actinomyces ruminicola TaxID=332524 RepID=A0A1H0F991_9ACTO|nr:hypothetical protein SAMN05216355_1241 [Actinomyces ruminicola]